MLDLRPDEKFDVAPGRLVDADGRTGESSRRPVPSRLSALLHDLAHDPSRTRVGIGDLCDSFGDRAFGALIFLFAAPNILPMPVPGLSAVTGLPLMVLTLQLMLGRPAPWLPGWIRQRSFERGDFVRIIDRLEPWLLRLERFLRPRLSWLMRPEVERVAGGLLLLLSGILFLPIPLGNMLPGLAMSLVALALLEGDGIVLLMGLVTALTSVAIVAGVVYGLVVAGLFLLTNAI